MHQLDQIIKRRQEIMTIIRRNNGAVAYLFGSCARREEKSDSDIDFIVKVSSGFTLMDHVRLERELGAALGRPVDVVDYDAIKLNNPRFQQAVQKDMIVL